ncbi:hypothetical protein L1987_47163 [Smallanthus sonchifolius]|uniref:Uncharacterized protein n=1 Tax=Smallanthus sonchifolius TaxID=185202 RepID=A0ACB9G2U0_9ASTR|nr:hypothetical protein L1987_47163 [Smallanthus sonchifolius]
MRREKEEVPADGLFVSGFSLPINESSLTGESDPKTVTAENPFLLSGTKVQNGSCKMVVTTVGMRTQWGKLMATLSEGGDDETPLQVKLNGVATIIGKIGLFFAVITFAVLVQGLFIRKMQEGSHWIWSGDDALAMLEYFAIAVMPEGLPLAVTLSLAFAMKKMMNDRALVRHLAACETMGSATNICHDKTGTLTTNHMTLVKAWICGEIREVKSASTFYSTIPDSVIGMFVESIFNNTGGEVVKTEKNTTEILGTPTETALLEFGLMLKEKQAKTKASKLVKVEPFNSEKKRMAVVLELEGGCFRTHCKGASEIILGACDKVLNRTGEVVPLDEELNNHLKDVIVLLANEALRTLCLCYKELGNEFNSKDLIPFEGYTLIGIVGIKDPVRPGVKESVAICRSAGITVRMVTGDNINTAKAIARECGILTDDGIAIEGPDFREKTEEELFKIIPKIQVMARSSPMDKHTLVKHLRTTFDEVVAVTGDGTNDAPALHEADIGLAMGIAGTEVAKESADVIILDDNFSTIVTVANAPLTAVQLLWVNMIMDTLGALALATEPPTDELMERTPVGRKGNFITNVMWRNIMGQSIYQFVVFNEISSREMEKIDVFKGILKNYVFMCVLTCTVIFQIIIIEFLGTFANTSPLTLSQWFACVTIGFLGMPIAAAVKMIPVGSR